MSKARYQYRSFAEAYVLGVVAPTILVTIMLALICLGGTAGTRNGWDPGYGTLLFFVPFFLLSFFVLQHFVLFFFTFKIVFRWAVIIIFIANLFASLILGPGFAVEAGEAWRRIRRWHTAPNQALQRTRTASAPRSWTPTCSTALPASAEGKR
jgi:hypothetical protein